MNNDYIISINEVLDRKIFFQEILNFYSPIECIFTVWGKLPKEVKIQLTLYKHETSLFRQLVFKEHNWNIKSENKHIFEDKLTGIITSSKFSFGMIKSNFSLLLLRNWDDIYLHSSEFLKKSELENWLDHIKSKNIIHSFEIVSD